jgi:DNA-binding transcriptional regulator YdaS (Cro superfamily)
MNATQTPEAGAKSPAEQAIELLGGATAVAKMLDLRNPQTVSNWKSRGVPPEHCPAIEAAVAARGGSLTRRDFRPDDWHRFWPEPAAQAA